MKNAFTFNEIENMFEIGRTMQAMCDLGEIKIEDSKEAFYLALNLAIEFENEFPESDDYYNDIDNFVSDNIPEELKII